MFNYTQATPDEGHVHMDFTEPLFDDTEETQLPSDSNNYNPITVSLSLLLNRLIIAL
jgi:hypothetical protein